MSSAVLLVGSPKPGASASRTVGSALLSRIAERGWETSIERVPTRDPEGTRASDVLARLDAADLVVLSFPLYIDTLPSPVTALLEQWARALTEGRLEGRPRLVVLVQSGFPEAAHTEIATTVCRSFARHAGLPWAGAVAFGMGGAMAGGSLERSPFARVAPLLDEAADALSTGEDMPASVGSGFARVALPKVFYLTVLDWAWRLEARRQGCTESLRLRRYA